MKIMLGVMLLTLMPVVATADDYTLGIFGNANEDDTIDMRDVAYTEHIILGLSPETRLADANYDGKVDTLDIMQIKLIILGKEKELTLIDSGNRITTVKKPIKRIVSISLYCSEPIRMFGEMDKIVAVQGNSKKAPVYFPQICKLPSIGGYPPDPEAILSFEPDLLIGATSWTKHLYGKLPNDVVPIVGLNFYNPSTFVEETVKLGYIMNKRDKADNYLSTFYNRYLDVIKSRAEKLSEKDKPKIYAESSMGDYKTHGGRNRAQTNIEIAGGRNIFADLADVGYFETDPEEVIVRNPDIIIKHLRHDVGYAKGDFSVMENKREEIMNRPELANVNAVKNGKVYILAERISYGFTYPVAIAYMAKWLHPDLFKDLDPRAMHQEFIDKFCPGINFNVYEQGIFVYPPLKQEYGNRRRSDEK